MNTPNPITSLFNLPTLSKQTHPIKLNTLVKSLSPLELIAFTSSSSHTPLYRPIRFLFLSPSIRPRPPHLRKTITRLPLTNLIALCVKMHRFEEFSGGTAWSPLSFGVGA